MTEAELPNHSCAGTTTQPAPAAAGCSITIQTAADRQHIKSATALRPVPLTPALPAANHSQTKSPKMAATINTPLSALMPGAHAITPTTKQIRVPAKQRSLSPAKLTGAHNEGLIQDEQQQKNSKEYRYTVSAGDDFSELELDADTGESTVAGGQPPAQPPAAAASQSVSQKRLYSQAPPDLSNPTLPLTKKHKTADGSAHAPVATSAGAPQQLAASQSTAAGCESSPCNTDTVPMPSSSTLSLQMAASTPAHSQKAVALPVALRHAAETAADRTASPLPPQAGVPDMAVFGASQQLVLSSSASGAADPARVVSSALTCQVPATLSGEPARQLVHTDVAASACAAGKDGMRSPQPRFAPLSRHIVTIYSHSGIAQPSPGLPPNITLLPRKRSSSYRPVIEELPSLPCVSMPTAHAMPTANSMPNEGAKPSKTTAAKAMPASKPTAIIIDIDSDDDKISAANTQPAASMCNDKPDQAQDRSTNLSTESALQVDAARLDSRHGPGQSSHSADPSAKNKMPCDATILAPARQVSIQNPPAPVGMGDIFSSFSALEALSDAEEEEGGTDPEIALSAGGRQAKNAAPSGMYTR